MARIGKTGNAKIAKKALARISKMNPRASSTKTGEAKCRAAIKTFAEAAAHTGAALHGGEKAKGLHKQLHGAEKKVTSLCALSKPAGKKKRSSRRRSSADDFDLGDYFGGGRGGGSSSSSSRSTVAARPTFYAPASGSGGGAFTREQFNRATGFSGLRRRKRK